MDTKDLKNKVVRIRPIVDECIKYLYDVEEMVRTEWHKLDRDAQFSPRGRSLHRVKKALAQGVEGLKDCQGETLKVWLREGGLI